MTDQSTYSAPSIAAALQTPCCSSERDRHPESKYPTLLSAAAAEQPHHYHKALATFRVAPCCTLGGSSTPSEKCQVEVPLNYSIVHSISNVDNATPAVK